MLFRVHVGIFSKSLRRIARSPALLGKARENISIYCGQHHRVVRRYIEKAAEPLDEQKGELRPLPFETDPQRIAKVPPQAGSCRVAPGLRSGRPKYLEFVT